MANQVAAALAGHDYQHLFAWREALDLLRPRKGVLDVRVEDEEALSVDDVTVRYVPGAGQPGRFFQVKYHVDQRDAYSTDVLMQKRTASGTSLLQKFWRTYQGLATRSAGPFELALISNWGWDVKDPFVGAVDGDDGRIKEDFLDATPGSDLGKVRARWREHLGATDAEFAPFVRALRIRHGYYCWRELRDGVAERMENLGLHHDKAALHTATGIVREWIKRGPSVIDAEVMQSVIAHHRLVLPAEAERATTVVMNTIATPRLEVAPDFTLDWCDRFEGEPGRRGRQLLDPKEWNGRLLPELRVVERRIKEETTDRLIRARGAARLSPWIAFGATFSEVAGYIIEVEQRLSGGRVERWRSDVPASVDFVLEEVSLAELADPVLSGPADVLAVGISVTDDVQADVVRHLQNHGLASRLLFLRPRGGSSPGVLRGPGDATSLAEQAKRMIRRAVREATARRVLLYYCGPMSGACFIGHRLNAVASEIVLMEDQQPGYAPSFILTS